MKKTPHIYAAIITWLFCIAPHSFALDTVFPKGAEVQLKAETPLLFKGDIVRTGKAGEKFVVLQDDPAAKKVFVLAKDAAGKEIALNIAEEAVEFAPFDIAALRTSLLQLSAKDDLANAAASVDAAATKAPAEAKIQEYRTAILAAKNAQDKVGASAVKAEEVKKRVAQLSKSAWAAASSRLDPNGGFARSQQMKAEADKLTADSNAQSASAKTELEAAKRNLATALETSASGAGSPLANTSVAPAQKATAAPSRDTFKETVAKFNEMRAKYNAVDDAISLPKLEKDKFYFVGGGAGQIFFIVHTGEDFILAANVRKQPWAILIFEDPKSIEGFQLQTGTAARAIGKFVQFKELPMADGSSQRFPVFSCVGFEINGVPEVFINTERK